MEFIMSNNLYVILFSDGDIKVGKTTDFKRRLRSHESENMKIGKRSIVSYFNQECLHLTEAVLIRMCEVNAREKHGAEYFSGLDFDLVKSAIYSDCVQNLSVQNSVMTIVFEQGTLPIEHKTQIGNLADVFAIGNKYRALAGRAPANLTNFCKSTGTQEFIDSVAKRLGVDKSSLLYTKGKGKGKSSRVVANIFITIYAAEYLSPDFHVEVIDTFINSKLLTWRDESGDDFVTLNKEIAEHASGLLGKPAHQGHFLTLAKIVNSRIGDKIDWNTASSEQLQERSRIETGLSTSIRMGFIKDWEHLKQVAAEI
jgi:hypothetical protein